MPSRNIVKTYVAEGFYHIYNRGVEKRIIFEDDMDYKTFLKYLKEALSVPTNLTGDQNVNTKKMVKLTNLQGETLQIYARPTINFSNNIDLIAYCLMPNHFHLIVKQKENKDIKRFVQSISTRYSMYFNKKYSRVGKLFQGTYKAAIITGDNYLLHLSRYVHTNPSEHFSNLEDAYSSYAEYLGIRKTSWIKPQVVLLSFKNVSKDFMQGINTYKNFIEGSKIDTVEILGNLTLEN